MSDGRAEQDDIYYNIDKTDGSEGQGQRQGQEKIPVPDDDEAVPVPEDQERYETSHQYEDDVGVVLTIGPCSEQRELQTGPTTSSLPIIALLEEQQQQVEEYQLLFEALQREEE
eukprot:4274625-Heterocapsa_arctica.AAC.1